MSRKNLSRTVIEGGRRYYNSWDRGQSHREERASTRAWLDQVSQDSDVADELVLPARRRVSKDFHDKLGPAKRWLAAQVGRPWNKVYAELRAMFDSRTIAGAHVVNDHMLQWVDRGDPLHALWGPYDFVIDPHGILRRGRFYGASWSRLRKVADALAQGRRAAETRGGWWWFRVAGKTECFDAQCTAAHEEDVRRRYDLRFVAARAMTGDERRRLDRLHPYFRAKIVMIAP